MPRTKKTPEMPAARPQLVRKPTQKPSPAAPEPALHSQIEERAYRLFLEGGSVHGNHVEHWLAAEREIMGLAPVNVARPAMAGRAGRAQR